MELHVDAAFGHLDAFGFEEFSLQGCVGLSNEKLATCAENAMPGDGFARRACSHGAASGSCAAREAQGSSNGPIR